MHLKTTMQRENLRHTFLSLIHTFPSLDISITHAESTEIHIRDESGDSFSLALNLLKDSETQIRETIFSIKEKLKIFDS